MPTPSTKRPYKKSNPTLSIARSNPVFTYTSTCCDAAATKTPCIRTQESREANEFSKSSLGTWNCSRCRRKCPVTRSRNKPAIAEGVAA